MVIVQDALRVKEQLIKELALVLHNAHIDKRGIQLTVTSSLAKTAHLTRLLHRTKPDVNHLGVVMALQSLHLMVDVKFV